MKMNFSFPRFLLASLLPLFLVTGNSLTLETQVELGGENSLQEREIREGRIQVFVNYTPKSFEPVNSAENNIDYRIFYNGVEQLQAEASTLYMGRIFLEDLDNSGTPEVIVQTYSGGAHCCTNFQIYSWQDKKNQFVETQTGFLDGWGGEFQDLNGDGRLEFISFDNSFLYRFSSYAGSVPPAKIFTFEQGELRDITRNYPEYLEEESRKIYEIVTEARRQQGEINGVLAGYVAQNILLGKYEQVWQFMLENYDRTSPWGLEIYKDDELVGEYPDFPTALKAFLIEQGYLDSEGKPL